MSLPAIIEGLAQEIGGSQEANELRLEFEALEEYPDDQKEVINLVVRKVLGVELHLS